MGTLYSQFLLFLTTHSRGNFPHDTLFHHASPANKVNNHTKYRERSKNGNLS